MLLKYRWAAVSPIPLFAVAKLRNPCWGKQISHIIDISVKHHHTFKALSNMPIREQTTTDEDGMVWTYFKTTPSMSICEMPLVLTDFVHVHNANKTINLWCRPHLTSHMKYAQSVAEKIIERLTEYANIIKKISKIDHVVIPDFPFIGLSYMGLIYYR